jgi:DNA polymerase-3 subunit delta|tara:strand:- start:1853 stop:2848 length:996 start_codon:yes stop_codon:yes gene_type:complete
MIIKSFEVAKIDFKNKYFFLLYGQNEGHKKQIIDKEFRDSYDGGVYVYEESEILKNEVEFFNNILSKSFFEKKKLIIISRATDKIQVIIEELLLRKIDDLTLVLNAGALEKKSKLRSYFEKNKETICVPFYEDNNQTLNSIVSQFFKKKKISISQQLINVLIERCSGDRKNLNNELEKIESFFLGKKRINLEEIVKLTNLADNYSNAELIDHCLAKNTRKTINILNENNYSNEDCIIIIRTLLAKLKRLIRIYDLTVEKNNIESAIESFKPPIFWKDKAIVTQQIKMWKKSELNNLIYKTTEIEYLIKKNLNIGKNLLFDFIISNSKKSNN